MSQLVKSDLDCPCGEHRRCYAEYDDGHGYCFSCQKTFHDETFNDRSELMAENWTLEYLPRREITKETHEFFGVKTKVAANGEPYACGYTFPNGSTIERIFPKQFRTTGDIRNAYGWGPQFFPAGSAKAVTICEGMDDAMSAFQMLGRYPVYSVKSSSSALRDVRGDYDYLNSFEKIYLALDDDDPGRKAAAEIAACFEFNKIFHVKLAPYKDPHEFLEAGKISEFRNCWYNAGRFLPEGVVSSFADVDKILDDERNDPGHPWPFKTLSYFTDGIKRGRAYLVTGLEGIGKTEFFHAVEYHLASTDPDANIAIIHLEEPTGENVRKLVGYRLRTPTTFSDSVVSTNEVKEAYRAIAGREDRIHFYNHYGSDDPDVLEAKIRFFVAACKCKYVFLDNITITATGRMQDDERKELDYFSTRLEMMVKQLNFALVAISHENDMGQTRGSRNISKVFDVWIKLSRNLQAETEVEKNTLWMELVKGRGCRGTGPVGRALYDSATGVLEEVTNELPV